MRSFSGHRPLLVCATPMAGLVLAAGIGLVVDERTLLGESVWLKPAKFGFAFALYAFGYWGLVAIVTWQAGRGQSLIHPDPATIAAFAAVVLLTVAAAVRVIVTARRTVTADTSNTLQLTR